MPSETGNEQAAPGKKGLLLEGVRVIDLGRYIAGPLCAALLGDLGADVIRVDRPGGSEDRDLMPLEGAPDGMLFLVANRNKRSVTIDMSDRSGIALLQDLVKSAQIVVANLPPSALQKIGMDYDSLVKLRPDIILTTINTYGPTGPDADKGGFDGLGQAISGAMAVSGPDGWPTRSQVTFVDYSSALTAAFGTMAAYADLLATGRGQHVQSSLLGNALMMMNPIILEETVCRRPRSQSGNRSPVSGPSDAFRTRDGWIVVQVVGNAIFKRWATLIGRLDLVTDARFLTDPLRGFNGAELSDLMNDWCSDKTTAEALALLEASRIPAGPMLSPGETVSYAPLQAAGFFQPLDIAGYPTSVPMVRSPVDLSRRETIMRAAPRLGEHTAEILRDLGIDEDAQNRLKADGII